LRFWALYENWNGGEHNYPLEIAVEKLINAPYSTIFTVEPKPAAVLAALDQRLHLTYDQRRPSVRMIEEAQVSKHMRLVYIAPQHGRFLYTGYSSEPFLAEAGAHALSAWRKNYGRVAVETLAYGIDTILSTQGNAGELVGRFILMSAYDYAVESSMRPVADSPPHPPHFSAGVDMEIFLRALIPNEHVEYFLDSKPINLPSSSSATDSRLLQELDIPLRRVFLNASIRFTHFIQTTDDVHVDTAWAALCRGAAILCHHAQEAVDLVIPVVLNRDNRIVKDEITAVFVRCKLRPRHPPLTSDIDVDSIQFFGSGQLPYVAITMDLGEDQDEVEYPTQPTWSSSEIPDQLSEVHPRYAIAIRGCSSRVYAAVDPEEEAHYKKLFGKNVLSEHTRQGKDNLDAVRRLAPLWVSGEASLGWVEDDPSVEEQGTDKKRKRGDVDD
jgi:hypothetical protein